MEHGGFINQYYGDGIMALFPNADEAMRGALALVRAVEAFNRDEALQGVPPINVGVGLNAGELAMGTIGGRVRLDSGVVGDAVNTAARIEGMTKMYATRVLVGESVVSRLPPKRRRSASRSRPRPRQGQARGDHDLRDGRR